MNTSPTIGKLGLALAAAQGEMRPAAKDAENPHFRSRYADLASVWDACRAPLAKHGLAVVQTVAAQGDVVRVTTLLIHGESGEWISDELHLVPKDASPQSAGSAITYGRRYGLSAMVGVAPDDDDGNAAQPAAGAAPRRAAGPVGNGAAPAQPGAPATPATGSKTPATSAPPAAAPATGTTGSTASASTPDPHKAECERLVKQLGDIAGQDFAKQLWHATKPGEKRRDVLRQAHAACAEVLTVLGEGRGTEVLVDLCRRDVSVIDRVALLVRASLGEPVPADPSQPPF